MDHSRNPETRPAALLGVARRCLGLSLREAAQRIGRSFETLANGEGCKYRLAADTESRLIRAYLVEFEHRGIASLPQAKNATLPELRVLLATAVVASKTSSLIELAHGMDGGQTDLVDAAINGGLADGNVRQSVVRRLREELVEGGQ